MILFANYETSKIYVDNPTVSNFFIILILLLISLLFKKSNDECSFLCEKDTTQLKGVAILLVIVGHLWVHVSEQRAIPVLSDYAVSMFFMLSGFGLTISLQKNGIRHFFARRFNRLIYPYWLLTCLWLFLDWYFLGHTYALSNIISTFLGLNLSQEMRHLDYVRWFITLLIMWYALFNVFNIKLGRKISVVFLFSIGILLCILRKIGLFTLGYPHQIIAFPIGCLIGLNIYRIRTFITGDKRFFLFFLSSGSLLILSITILFQESLINFVSQRLIHFIIENTCPFIFCITLSFAVSLLGNLYSQFLYYCGAISYELFLIHGPLLIKYNFVFPSFSPKLIVFSFLLFLSVLIALSNLMHTAIGKFEKLSVK